MGRQIGRMVGGRGPIWTLGMRWYTLRNWKQFPRLMYNFDCCIHYTYDICILSKAEKENSIQRNSRMVVTFIHSLGTNLQSVFEHCSVNDLRTRPLRLPFCPIPKYVHKFNPFHDFRYKCLDIWVAFKWNVTA